MDGWMNQQKDIMSYNLGPFYTKLDAFVFHVPPSVFHFMRLFSKRGKAIDVFYETSIQAAKQFFWPFKLNDLFMVH